MMYPYHFAATAITDRRTLQYHFADVAVLRFGFYTTIPQQDQGKEAFDHNGQHQNENEDKTRLK